MKKETKRKLIDRGVRSFSSLQRVPGARLLPWFNPANSDMRWLPINQDIELPGSSPMPVVLADRLIEEASHRVIYHRCGCRSIFGCKNYPRDIGCLLMGDSALEANPNSASEVTVDEAKAHVRRAVEAGLVPIIGKARIDNLIFGIKERGSLLTTCFCCECCCITRYLHDAPVKMIDPVITRLEGLRIEVTDDCTGCGACVDKCFIRAITIKDGKASMSEYCRACGRCATVCPSNAISVIIEDSEFINKAVNQIKSYVKYD